MEIDLDHSEAIVGHIVDILAGECRLSLEDVAAMGDGPLAQIFAGLVHLHEDLQFRERQRADAVSELEQLASELQRQNDELSRSRDEMRGLIENLSSVMIRLPGNISLLPLVGNVDERRATLIFERLLAHVAKHKVRAVILELSGVSDVDEMTVDVLLRVDSAVRMLGSRTVLTGIRPSVARAIVDHDYDGAGLLTAKDVAEALRRVHTA